MSDPSQPKTHKKFKVFIVDDHPVMCDGLTRLISSQSDLIVCGDAMSAKEALKLMPAAQPDIATVDISLPDSSGLTLIKDMKLHSISCPVLVLSIHDESVYVERALQAGARGYIMKQDASKEVLQAIRRILEGEIYLSKIMTARIPGQVAENRPILQGQSPRGLSDQELQVYQLIGSGHGTAQMAEDLNISAKRIELYRDHIKVKLNFKTAHELNQHAIHWAGTKRLS